MLHSLSLDDDPIRVTIGGREFFHDIARNKLLPVIAGAAEGDPPTPPAAPPAALPPAPATPDLAALQAELDRARTAGTSEATSTLLKQLGFDKLEDAAEFVQAKREADTAQLSEVEKREKAAADALAAAQAREGDAKRLIERGIVRNALQTAGVAVENLDDVEGSVRIEGEITAETAKAAVDAMKAKPVFVSYFTAAATPAPPPSGHTPGTPPPAGQPSTTLLQKGADIARQRHPQPATNGTAA